MKKILFIVIALVYSSFSFSQILITDPDLDTLNPMNCAANSGPAPNFFDSGNNSANYGPNENETIVVCPDYSGGTSKLSLTFGINTGLLFGVDASDTVFVYDGLSTLAPLLGKHNSSTDPTGFNHVASFVSNPSGCLTVQFVSDGATEGIGWDANITCVTIPQPFEVHMQGYLNGVGSDIINPSDTGYADVCFEDSILFVGSGIFPYSSDVTGVGYSQNATNVTYNWNFSDGSQATGDSVWFKPPARSGYLITLKISDSFPQAQSIMSKVRVSTIPSFVGVINNRDSICVGDTTVIVGAVTSTDTAGVDPTSTNFQLGGSFAGLTWLPDGSGLNYTTSVNISGFLPSQTVTSAADIQKINIVMEHSYLGDLEMQLTCPNGTTSGTIFNSYGGGGDLIPGGFNGGSVHLGDAYDDNLGTPGVGWSYDFTDNAANPTFATAYTNATYLTTVGNATTNPFSEQSLVAGTYQVEQPLSAFIGCPLNGNWTITVRDNLGIDDGYIFEWGIFFDPNINPNNETYAPTIVSSQWLTAATILPGLPTDTFIVVTSNNSGAFNYTFQVTDNYGCNYDTTVQVYFLPTPEVQVDTNACAGQYQVVGTTSFNGGTWAATGPGNATFSPSNAIENPFVTVDANGTYTFTFTDNQCGLDTAFEVYFADSVFVNITGADFCVGDDAEIDATSQVLEASYLWNTGSTTPMITVTDSGTYSVVVTGLCNSDADTVIVTTTICGITAPNVITPNGDGMNDVLFFTGLDRFPNSRLEVYNRWGLLIYDTDNYQNDWSPTSISDGTYYYILTPSEGKVTHEVLKGAFTVLK